MKRSPRGESLAVILMLLGCICTSGSTSGCNPQVCDARGESTPVAGIISYVVGANAGTTFSGSIDVFDYNQSCTYDDEEFPVTAGSCTLWAHLRQGAEPPISYRGAVVFPGNSSGWAQIEAGQMCNLPVLGGNASVTVTDGAVAFSESSTTLFLTGSVATDSDAGGDDTFQWQFQANGVPE